MFLFRSVRNAQLAIITDDNYSDDEDDDENDENDTNIDRKNEWFRFYGEFAYLIQNLYFI